MDETVETRDQSTCMVHNSKSVVIWQDKVEPKGHLVRQSLSMSIFTFNLDLANHNETIKKQMQGVRASFTNNHNKKLKLVPTSRCLLTPGFGEIMWSWKEQAITFQFQNQLVLTKSTDCWRMETGEILGAKMGRGTWLRLEGAKFRKVFPKMLILFWNSRFIHLPITASASMQLKWYNHYIKKAEKQSYIYSLICQDTCWTLWSQMTI